MKEPTIRFLKSEAYVFLSLWGACILPSIGSILCFIYLLYKTATKDEWVSKVLFFALSIRMLNPYFFSPGIIKTFGSWVLLLFVFLRLIFIKPKVQFKQNKILILFFILCIEFLISSLFKSQFLGISIFKLVSFWIGFYAVYIGLQNKLSFQWESLLFTFWQLIVWLSIPFLFLPSLGYAVNGTGFQGITLHPQSFGTILAPLTIFFGYFIIIKKSIQQNIILTQITFIVSLYLLVLTQSRTAVFSLVISLCIYLIYSFLKLQSRRDRGFNIRYRSAALAFLFIFLGIFKYDQISTSIEKFILKRESDEIVTVEVNGEKLFESRQEALNLSIQNFKDNKWFGIGFGVPSNIETFQPQYLSGTNIPISAPVEKGIIGPALLEENGLVGTLLFTLWIIFLAFKILSSNAPGYLLLFFTMFIVNFGELIFFSANGFGVYSWYLMLLAYFRVKYPNIK